MSGRAVWAYMAEHDDEYPDRLFSLSEANRLIPCLEEHLSAVKKGKAVLVHTKDEIKKASNKEPQDLFGHPPSTPGYDQLKNIESGITDASWKAEFRDSSGESLLVLGVAEPGTRLFRALTPPLGGFYKQMVTDRSPRPMLMSRRISSATRFAHLIHAFRGTPGVSDINAVAGGYRVRHSGGVDEIFADLHNLEFRLIRREGDRITAISGYGIEELTLEQKILVRSATRLSCLECSPKPLANLPA